ncbi:MAG: S9 family peptidase [Spirosomataceae bacterium]
MKFAHFFLLGGLLISSPMAFAQTGASISFEQYLSLKQAGSPTISPDGKHVVYTVTSTDWKENTYDTELWLARDGETPFQLTRTPKGSSTSPRWSPDGKWIAFLADRGDKSQIFVLRASGGEAQQVTKEDEGVTGFEWSPDGKQFALLKNDPESKAEKARKEKLGAWAVDDEEYQLTHLWLADFRLDSLPKATRLTEGKFTVNNFFWSPDGKMIAFSHQPNPLINSSKLANISIIELPSKKITEWVKNPLSDSFAAWSPDSKAFLYVTSPDDSTSYFYKNNRLFRMNLADKSSVQLAKDFDENIGGLEWTPSGIFFSASQRTQRSLFRLDPASGRVQMVTGASELFGNFTFSQDGKIIAFSASSATALAEIFKSNVGATFQPTQLTNLSEQIKGWKTAVSEVVRWQSKDGAEIEGVLHKPANYDPKKKYPLMVMIHGGPTGVDTPTPVPGGAVYPVLQWLEKGALVLRPNYRGSAGYGEAFRSLNVRNLGVGDMWDVMSGVEYLEKQGLIDANKMGCMGWSQGGYISAFLTTNTTRFKAISVGAGISNWLTYYVNTDIHPFTRQYLKATPWQDMDIYLKTSPMTTIRNAKTPTLIQHGEFDRRVPIPNAYELLQGLQDNGVPAKLVVYKGFGHGITKPKERLAALWHNWQWFSKYVFGEEIELPTGGDK